MKHLAEWHTQVCIEVKNHRDMDILKEAGNVITQTRQLKYSKLRYEVSPTEIKFPELLNQWKRLVFLL